METPIDRSRAGPLLVFRQPLHPRGDFPSSHETAPAGRPACAIRSGTVVLTVRGSSIHVRAARPDAIWLTPSALYDSASGDVWELKG